MSQSPQQPSMFANGDSIQPDTLSPTHDMTIPLATRMRPVTLDEIRGQDHLLGQGRPLRRSIELDRIASMIFWGPPGSGKTTLAEVIAHMTKARFVHMSAVIAGVAELRRVVEDATKLKRATGQRTILFLDEIHRFNKSQQDSILPHVERGTITLIGATTENPSFEVNAALLSRCRVFTLQAITEHDIKTILQHALQDNERGLGEYAIALDIDAGNTLAVFVNGDARMALTALDMAAQIVRDAPPTERRITLEMMQETLQHRTLFYDKTGEEHYNLISALHKSIRGSDPDAAVYWLVRMIESGEDPLYIARRLLRMASEDIGLADPHALSIAVAAQQAVHMVGLPEGALALVEAAVYLACAPKSNALERAYMAARNDVLHAGNEPVPLHLRNAPTNLMRASGYGNGYVYAHDIYAHIGSDSADENRPPPQSVQPEGYLPQNIQDHRYYEPGEHAQGNERDIARWIKRRYRVH